MVFPRQERPRLPVELTRMTPEEYGAMLRSVGYSQHAVDLELSKLERFQVYVGSIRDEVPEEKQEPDPNDTLAAAVARRRRRKEAKNE